MKHETWIMNHETRLKGEKRKITKERKQQITDNTDNTEIKGRNTKYSKRVRNTNKT
jgi:hypothetical protein